MYIFQEWDLFARIDPFMNMKPTLLGLHARIMAAIMPRELANIVIFELLPLLGEQGPLKSAYDMRIHYYDRLSKDEQYLVLIQSIHALMKDMYPLIDPSKFPRGVKQKFYHQMENDRRDLIPAEELHPLLIQKDQWQYLGHVQKEYGTKDSVLCPWTVILVQYSVVRGFARYAIEVGAAAEEPLQYYARELSVSYQKIRQLLQGPFERLHIREFERFHILTQEPDKLLNEWNIPRTRELREAADCVCQELLSALDILEAEARPTLPKIDEASQEKNVILTEWMGDQPISYKDGLLKIGQHEIRRVPAEEKSEFRRVLLELLVQEYQQPGEGMAITPNVFATRLHEIGFEPRGRALQTATRDVNDEIEKAFHLKRFVRMRGGTAFIFKKREAAMQETAAKQLHTAV